MPEFEDLEIRNAIAKMDAFVRLRAQDSLTRIRRQLEVDIADLVNSVVVEADEESEKKTTEQKEGEVK